MADSAEGTAPKDAAALKGEAGASIAAEDAERFAEAFVPSWQFDQAPFTPGVMTQEEMERLSGATVPSAPPAAPVTPPPPPAFRDDLTASDVDVSTMVDHGERRAPVLASPPPVAPPPSDLAPLGQPTQPMVQPTGPAGISGRGTLMMAGGPPAAPIPSAPPPPPPVQNRGNTARMKAPQVAQQPARLAPVMARPQDEDSASLMLGKPKRAPLIIAAVALVGAVAIFAGVRAMSHGEETGQTTTATAAPPPPPAAHTEETAIPPPPPPAEPPVAAAAAAPADPVADTPRAAAPAPPPRPPPVVAVTALPPSPRPTPAAPPPPRVAAQAAPAPRPAPAPPPKSSTKASGGGIVRDNPF